MSAVADDRPLVGVAAVVLEGEDLLMIRRARPPGEGTWSLPGGRVEHGETLAEAVVRELAEETGLEGVCGDLVGWSEVLEGAFHAVILDFRVRLFERSEPHAADDASEAEWVPVGEVAARILAPGLAEFLHDHGLIPTIT